MNEWIFGLAIAAVSAAIFGSLGAADKQTTASPQDEPQGPTKEQEQGAAVRSVVYAAYRGMLKQHAHGLWRLSACLAPSCCPSPAVATFALQETAQELARFNCRPLLDAIEELQQM